MSSVFVIDRNRQPQTRVHPAQARGLLKQGQAAVYRRYPWITCYERVKRIVRKVPPTTRVSGASANSNNSHAGCTNWALPSPRYQNQRPRWRPKALLNLRATAVSEQARPDDQHLCHWGFVAGGRGAGRGRGVCRGVGARVWTLRALSGRPRVRRDAGPRAALRKRLPSA